jgi:hypothetical protein
VMDMSWFGMCKASHDVAHVGVKDIFANIPIRWNGKQGDGTPF